MIKEDKNDTLVKMNIQVEKLEIKNIIETI